MFGVSHFRIARQVNAYRGVTPTARVVHPCAASRPILKSVPIRSGSLAADWAMQKATRSLAVMQQRSLSTEPPSASGTGDLPDAEAYLKRRGFTDSDIEKIRKTTEGVTFKVIPIGTHPDDLAVTERFVDIYFRKMIESSENSSALGGEKVLLFNPAKPEQGKPDSSFLMAFDGEQDPHFHGGPRHLDMWSASPWTVIVGGAEESVLEDDEVHFTKIDMPAGHVSLSFRKNMLHGFSGKGIGAISTHWTDKEELELAKQKSGKGSDVSSRELMSTLTRFVAREKIRVIGEQGVPWHIVSGLQTSASKDE